MWCIIKSKNINIKYVDRGLVRDQGSQKSPDCVPKSHHISIKPPRTQSYQKIGRNEWLALHTSLLGFGGLFHTRAGAAFYLLISGVLGDIFRRICPVQRGCKDYDRNSDSGIDTGWTCCSPGVVRSTCTQLSPANGSPKLVSWLHRITLLGEH